MTPADDLLSLQIPCAVHAPRMVRAALSQAYDGDWPLDDGLLVASELVTNAVEHSGCSAEDTLTVDVARHGENLVISVHDPGRSGEAAEPVKHERLSMRGRGLQIVEALSVRWGAERPDGYRVWAVLPAQPSARLTS